MEETAGLSWKLSRYMAEQGLKNTRQRQLLWELFLETREHIAIDDMLSRAQERMPGVGYATVYRTLKLFVEAGVAHERHFGDGQSRYEPARAGEHHDHLICVVCSHIFEFEDPIIEERQLRVAEQAGLRIVSHHHDIFGRCQAPESCAWRATEEKRARPV